MRVIVVSSVVYFSPPMYYNILPLCTGLSIPNAGGLCLGSTYYVQIKSIIISRSFLPSHHLSHFLHFIVNEN